MDQSPAAAALQLAFKAKLLISAVKTVDTETVVDLLDRGVPIDTKDDEGNSLLHWSAEGGHVTTISLLIKRGCDVDSVDGSGLTPLHWAAAMGQIKAVRELIWNGANKSVVAGEYGTPLHQAAKKGHVDTVAAILDEGCPVDEENTVKATALHWAAEGGHVEVVRELACRGCDVNAVKADGRTPLHLAASNGKAETVSELLQLGAIKLMDACVFGTPLHQAAIFGHVEAGKILLKDDICEPDSTKHSVTHSKAQIEEYNVITTCDSIGLTPAMSAALCGQVDMFKLLTSKGAIVSDRDTYSLSAFEYCFSGGQASKLTQLSEVCGIGSNGEGLRGALAKLISQGLVDAHKVLCLCAMSGDSIFLEDQFNELVASDGYAMPAALKCVRFYFFKGIPFFDQLNLPDESALNPLHMSLLSMKCFELGFVVGPFERGTKDHTSFITKLLSHPVLKRTVNENFPNGLSPLDLARQFELRDIATLIERAGGCPGVWVKVPLEIEVKHPQALAQFKAAYASIKAIAEEDEHGLWFIRSVFSSFLHQPLWNPNAAATVGANVGAERDEHEYKSLMEYIDGVSQPLSTLRGLHERVNKATYRKVINAMLNSPNGGSIHFGIGDDGIVEEGLHLDHEQNHAMDELRKKVGSVLNSFQPPVESYFAQVEPINLQNDKGELTGRWRFDIDVKPCKEGAKVDGVAYHRVGPQTVRMSDEVFAKKFPCGYIDEPMISSRKSRVKCASTSHRKLEEEERSMDAGRMSHGKSRKGQKEPSQKHPRKLEKRRR